MPQYSCLETRDRVEAENAESAARKCVEDLDADPQVFHNHEVRVCIARTGRGDVFKIIVASFQPLKFTLEHVGTFKKSRKAAGAIDKRKQVGVRSLITDEPLFSPRIGRGGGEQRGGSISTSVPRQAPAKRRKKVKETFLDTVKKCFKKGPGGCIMMGLKHLANEGFREFINDMIMIAMAAHLLPSLFRGLRAFVRFVISGLKKLLNILKNPGEAAAKCKAAGVAAGQWMRDAIARFGARIRAMQAEEYVADEAMQVEMIAARNARFIAFAADEAEAEVAGGELMFDVAGFGEEGGAGAIELRDARFAEEARAERLEGLERHGRFRGAGIEQLGVEAEEVKEAAPLTEAELARFEGGPNQFQQGFGAFMEDSDEILAGGGGGGGGVAQAMFDVNGEGALPGGGEIEMGELNRMLDGGEEAQLSNLRRQVAHLGEVERFQVEAVSRTPRVIARRLLGEDFWNMEPGV